jgi:hypothetical protein
MLENTVWKQRQLEEQRQLEVANTAVADIVHKLRKLLGASATAILRDIADELLTAANCSLLHDVLLASLLGAEHGSSHMTEMESLTAIVRLLGIGTGDPNGETVTPEYLDPHAGDVESNEREGESSIVARVMCSQSMVNVILDLLARHAPEFSRGESLYLRYEALKALRLVMTPSGLMRVSLPCHNSHTAEGQVPWWCAEKDLGYLQNGETRRRLVEALLHQLQSIGNTMQQKPKIVILGTLWSVAGASCYARTRILQSGGQAFVAQLFREQVYQPQIIEAALVAECGVLITLTGGSRAHQRQMAKLGVDQDAVEMLRRLDFSRKIVCAGLILVALLANDDMVAARLSASPQALATISAARTRWPDDFEKVFQSNVHIVTPAALALLKGVPANSHSHASEELVSDSCKSQMVHKAAAERGNELVTMAAIQRQMLHANPTTIRRETPRGASIRSRPMRAAATCLVGRAGA